jgi:hypothetical protein
MTVSHFDGEVLIHRLTDGESLGRQWINTDDRESAGLT